MKVVVLLADGFEETEFVACRDILRRAEINVITIRVGSSTNYATATDSLLVQSGLGLVVRCDYPLIVNHNWAQYDALIIPGGMQGVNNLIANPEVLTVVRWFHEQKKLTGTICAGPLVLRAAGVIQDQHFTSYPGAATKFKTAANYHLSAGTVVDNQHQLVTSQSLGTVFGFALAMIERLLGLSAQTTLAPKLMVKPLSDIVSF